MGFLKDPYFDIKQGNFVKTLHSDCEFEKYIVYSVNELMNKLIEYHNK